MEMEIFGASGPLKQKIQALFTVVSPEEMFENVL